MDDVSRASLLELIAGKNRSSVIAAILQNGDILEKAYKDALSSSGAAAEELNTYLSSIQGHLDKFTNAVQTMWMNFISSDAIKFVVDLGTALIKFIDKVGVLKVLLGSLAGLAIFKYKDKLLSNLLNVELINNFTKQLQTLAATGAISFTKFASTLNLVNVATMGTLANTGALTVEQAGLLASTLGLNAAEGANVVMTQAAAIKKIEAAVAAGTLSAADGEAMVAALGLTVANGGLIATLKAVGIAALDAAKALWALIMATPLKWVLLIAAGITAAVIAIDALTTSHKEYVEQLKDTNQELEDLRSNIDALNSELKTTKERIEELENKGPLTLTEQEELEKLKEQNAELERQIQLEKAREERARNRQAEEAAGAFKSDKDFKPVMNIAGRVPVVTATNEFENKLDDIEYSKKKLDEAEQALQDAVNSGMDTESKKFKKLEKNLDEAQSDYIQTQTDWDDFMAEKEETYGDLEWFDKPKTEAQKAVNEFLSAMENYTDRAEILFGNVGAKESAITRLFGERGSEAGQAFDKAFKAKIESGEIDIDTSKFEDYSSVIDGVVKEIENLLAKNPQLKLQLDSMNISIEDVARHYLKIDEAMQQTEGTMSTAITDLSTLSSAYESYASTLQIANEAAFEGQAISEDYYNSLKEYLGDVTVGEESFGDAIDSTNGYIVKNTKLLKNLINQKKKDQKATVSSAKAQSQLQYSKLVKQLQQAVRAMSLDYKEYGYVTQATYQNISAIRSQIDAVKTAIREYAILELKLSDVTNAYTEFENAKNRDAELSYGDSLIEGIQALNDGFATGKVGTETFKAAVDLIVPEEAYKDLDDYQDRLVAIHDYVDKNPLFADWFTVDEDGNFGIEFKNMAAFVQDMQSMDVFTGDDITGFNFAEGIKSIDDIVAKTKEWNDGIGATESTIVAMLTELSKYDARWGDLLEELTMTDADKAFKKTTEALDAAWAKEEEFFKANKNPFGDNADEYRAIQEEVKKCSIAHSDAKKVIVENTNAWMDANEQVQTAQNNISKYSNELEQLKKSGASDLAIQVKTDELEQAKNQLTEALQEKYKLSEPTQMDFQIALEDVQTQIDNWKKSNAYLEATVVPKIEQDSNGVWKIPAEIEAELNDDDKQKIQEYIDLINDEQGLATLLGLVETDPAVTELVDIKGILTDIADKIGVSKSRDVTNEEGSNKSVKSQDLSTTNVQVPTSAAANNSDTSSSTGFNANGVDQKVLAWNAWWDNLEQEVGQFFTGMIDSFAQWASGIPGTISQLLGNAKTWAQGMGEVINSFFTDTLPQKWDEFWTWVGEGFNDFTQWAQELGDVADEFFSDTLPQMWNDFWNDVGEFVTQKVPTAIGEFFGTIDDIFDTVLGKLGELTGAALKIRQEFLDDPIGFISTIGSKIASIFIDLVNSVFDAWNSMADNVNSWVNTHIKEPANKMLQSVNNFFNSIPEKFDNMVDGAKELFNSLVDGFISIFDNASAWVNENIYQPLASIIARIDQFLANLPETLSKLWDSISEWINNNVLSPLGQLQIDFKAFIDSIPEKLKALWNDAGIWIDEHVLDPLEQLKTDVQDFLNGIPSALGSLWTGALDWLKEKASSWITGFKKGYSQDYVTTSDSSSTSTNRKSGNTIFAKGSDGLKTDEHNAIVGELGEELVVDTDRGIYYTVGSNGTEMVDLPAHAIIYNHKQTEELLKNGQTSRGTLLGGLSFARGNAHYGDGYRSGLYGAYLSDNAVFKGTSRYWVDANQNWVDDFANASDGIVDAADSLSDTASDASDAFEDTINWIEVLFTRIDNVLSEHEAYLATVVDSTGGLSTKDSIYQTMFGQMYNKVSYSVQAANYYQQLADSILSGMDQVIASKVRNGTILIEEITDEALKDNIDKALDYLDQASQYKQQSYSTLEEIADKAVERQNEAATAYENEIGLVEHLNNTLEARNDLEEAKEGFATEAYYKAQISANNIILDQKRKERDALQAIFDQEVANGNVKIGSQQWFDMQNAIYDVDDAIIDTEASIEDLQNSINDLYWDRFDELINRFGYLEDEISNVVQLLSHDPDGLIMEELRDLTSGNWATGSGLATLGLYAQQMEEAQYVANQCAEQIKELKEQYAAGKYNETEYLKKLNELTGAQYENIEKYHDAKDAIVELNKARVDAIRDGIELEIDKYDELIQKKKELLNREQD